MDLLKEKKAVELTIKYFNPLSFKNLLRPAIVQRCRGANGLWVVHTSWCPIQEEEKAGSKGTTLFLVALLTFAPIVLLVHLLLYLILLLCAPIWQRVNALLLRYARCIISPHCYALLFVCRMCISIKTVKIKKMWSMVSKHKENEKNRRALGPYKKTLPIFFCPLVGLWLIHHRS